MTQTQLRHTQIYRLGVVLGLSLFFFLGINSIVYATQFGEIQYDNTHIDYSKIDIEATQKLADYYFEKALDDSNPDTQKEYLQKASAEYHILTHAQHNNIYPIIQMARVYDMEDENRYAKDYFFQALKVDKNNPEANYYFGEFYFKRKEYNKALYFYNRAFQNGFKENFDVLYKQGIIFEKFGDLTKAKKYYRKAFLAKPDSTDAANKIRSLENTRNNNKSRQ